MIRRRCWRSGSAAYRSQTEPLVHYYSERRNLLTIDGMMAIQEVTDDIERVLSALKAADKKPQKRPPVNRRRR